MAVSVTSRQSLTSRLRIAAWLGWQIESNWADPLIFVVYSVLRPLAVALILVGMYWAVAGQAPQREAFLGFFVANAFHAYITQVMVGMGWAVVEEREEYETLKYVYASPIGMFTYLAGRSSVKIVLATISMVLALLAGWYLAGLRWDWSAVAWGPLFLAIVTGLIACVCLGFLVAGSNLLMPRAAIVVNEGIAVALYLTCGVIFPVDLLPPVVEEAALALPFTYWYEALRRFLIGAGSSQRLAGWSDAQLLGVLIGTTIVFSVVSRWGYRALERRARHLGRLDQTTLF
jgi:ABC-2 type transport system permease protein